MRKSLLFCMCAFVLVEPDLSAEAELVQVQLSGGISEVSDAAGLFPDSVAVGAAFSGTWYYDTNSEDLADEDASFGYFEKDLSKLPPFSLMIGGNGFASDIAQKVFLNVTDSGDHKDVVKDHLRLSYDLDSSVVNAEPVLAYYAEMELEDHGQAAITSDAAPHSLSLAEWPDLQQFSLVLYAQPDGEDPITSIATGTISSLTTVQIPEPSSVWLLSLGITVSLLMPATRRLLFARRR